MKKTFMAIFSMGLALTLQSCLHDNTDLFGKSAAERMEEKVAESKELLESASNGWMMHFYYGENYEGGGFTYLCKFKDGKADVAGDLFVPDLDVVSPEYTARSSYDVTEEQGPVLTFNTGNKVMHFLAQPYQDDVDGDQGDYEFIIMKTTPDSIYLKGKKFGNKMVMTRLSDDFNWASYLTKLREVVKSMPYSYHIQKNGATIGEATFDAQARHATFTIGETVTEKAFYISETGICFQSPVTLGDATISELTWNASTLTMTDTENPSIQFVGYKPDNFMNYLDWQGRFVGMLDASQGNVQILMEVSPASSAENLRVTAPLEFNLTMTVSGLKYEMYATYNRANGHLSIPIQRCVDPTKEFAYLMMIPAGTENGYYYFNTSGSLDMIATDSQGNGVFGWDGNGKVKVNSMFFVACDETGNPIVEDESYVGVLGIPNFSVFVRYNN